MKKRIRDIAKIRTGYQFRGKASADTDANVLVIQIKDIDDAFNVQAEDLLPVRLEKPEQYLVSQGDVLFLSRGPRLFATMISQPMEDTIATSYFFILSPKATTIRPDFLAWYMNQPGFQESLRPFVRGSHMPLVSRADFQDIVVEVPPLVIQHKILELQHLLTREQQLTASVQEKRAELVQAVSRKLMCGQLITKDLS